MTQLETKARAHADYKSSLGYNYNECKSSFVDGAEWMLSKVFEILKDCAGNYSVEVGNAVETYVIDDIREALGEKVMTSKYKVGDIVGIYGYETNVKIWDIRWHGNEPSYLVCLADGDEWIFDDDIAYKS